MKKLFIILSSIFLLCLPSTVAAQEKFEAEISAGVVSNYMWRGLNLAGVSLQPQVKLAWQGLSLEATANTGIDKEELRDLDLTLDFSRWGFNIGITDYFNYNVDAKDRFFYYSGGEECPHALEANLGYTCKYGSIQAHTKFYGNDYKINGKRAYSTFIELDVPFRAAGLDWDVMVGITPFESAGVSHQDRSPVIWLPSVPPRIWYSSTAACPFSWSSMPTPTYSEPISYSVWPSPTCESIESVNRFFRRCQTTSDSK